MNKALNPESHQKIEKLNLYWQTCREEKDVHA